LSNLGTVTGLAFSGGKTNAPFGRGTAAAGVELEPLLPEVVVLVSGVAEEVGCVVEAVFFDDFDLGIGEEAAVGAGVAALTSAVAGTVFVCAATVSVNTTEATSSDVTLIMKMLTPRPTEGSE
jgi:hypothetical protein